jgi:hypothetical protein
MPVHETRDTFQDRGFRAKARDSRCDTSNQVDVIAESLRSILSYLSASIPGPGNIGILLGIAVGRLEILLLELHG